MTKEDCLNNLLYGKQVEPASKNSVNVLVLKRLRVLLETREAGPGTIVASGSVFEQRRIVLPYPAYRCRVALDHLVPDTAIGRHGW